MSRYSTTTTCPTSLRHWHIVKPSWSTLTNLCQFILIKMTVFTFDCLLEFKIWTDTARNVFERFQRVMKQTLYMKTQWVTNARGTNQLGNGLDEEPIVHLQYTDTRPLDFLSGLCGSWRINRSDPQKHICVGVQDDYCSVYTKIKVKRVQEKS